jgi:blue copper oxidase
VLHGPPHAVVPIPGSYLGPTLRFERGQKVRVRFRNRLQDPSIVHWHGLDVPETADGHPRLAVPGGAEYVYEFEVINRAGTYWYHPHPHMQTGPQVYSGLAGLVIVTDTEEKALRLPEGTSELLCVLQDRRFDAANQLVYSAGMMDMETGFLGSRVLVNGVPAPTWFLDARAYRIRFLNGSNARIYKLTWSDGRPITVLGTDGGLLRGAREMPFVTLAPGQRIDAWLDLGSGTAGTSFALESAAFPLADAGIDMPGMGRMAGMMGARGGVMSTPLLPLGARIPLLTIRIARRGRSDSPEPDRLSAFDRTWEISPEAPVRRVPLSFQMMQWKLGPGIFAMNEVAPEETVSAGSTHVWEFVNQGGPMGMQMAHPIHLHGRQFRIVGRIGGKPDNSLRAGLVDEGWTDTVLVLPQETVRVQIRFSDHRGLFLYHCHILEHEDMGMMRNVRVV